MICHMNSWMLESVLWCLDSRASFSELVNGCVGFDLLSIREKQVCWPFSSLSILNKQCEE